MVGCGPKGSWGNWLLDPGDLRAGAVLLLGGTGSSTAGCVVGGPRSCLGSRFWLAGRWCWDSLLGGLWEAGVGASPLVSGVGSP